MTDISRATAAPEWLARKKHPFCSLCGRPSAFVNVYLPGRGTPAAPPAGKGRMIIYSLCETCAGRLDVLAETIEARVETELRQAGLIRRHATVNTAATVCGCRPRCTPTPAAQASRHVEDTGLHKVNTMDWTEEGTRDEKMLRLLDLDLLDHDVVARGEGMARLVGDHNGRLADLTYRFNELVFHRGRLTDFSAWSDGKLDDLLAERTRLLRESWEWLQNLRAVLMEREAILKKAEEALRGMLDELNQRRQRTIARLSKSMAKDRRACVAANPYRGEAHFGELVESDDAVVAIDRQRAVLQGDLEWVADHRRRAMGGQSDVLARQEEVFKHLMN